MDDLTVRYLTDAELIAARRGGPLEPYGAQRTNLPGRNVGAFSSARPMTWTRRRPVREAQGTAPTK